MKMILFYFYSIKGTLIIDEKVVRTKLQNLFLYCSEVYSLNPLLIMSVAGLYDIVLSVASPVTLLLGFLPTKCSVKICFQSFCTRKED